MKSSSLQKRRQTKKSQSYERLNIQQLLSADRSLHKSMIYDKILPTNHQQSILKKNKFLIQLPKIYPIHKKLINLKIKDYQLVKFNQRKFHLRGIKFAHQLDYQDTTLQTQSLHKSQFTINKKQSLQTSIGSLFTQLIFKINAIKQFTPIKNTKLKAFVQEGNNSRLVKQLLRKRPQIKMVQSKTEADIVWTRFSDYTVIQKISRYTQKSQRSITSLNDRNQDDYIEALQRITQLQSSKILYDQNKRYIQLVSIFMHNHLKNHQEISDKKNLFKNIRTYCKQHSIDQGQIIPKTFHIDCAKFKNDETLQNKVQQIFNDKKFNNDSFFVVKPGQDTNRGQGITVVRGRQYIIDAIKQLQKKGKSSLIQQYINPLLYRNRKFDIRCYVLVTSVAGKLHAYWYKEGYLRTCVKQFSYDPNNIFGHLTNDAVQKKHKDYGKFQQANKLSFNDLEAILTQTQRTRQQVIKEMKSLAKQSIKSVQQKLRGQKNIFGFEIFGYDFLIDREGKVWLIEVNTNPCLQFSGSLLSRIIWHMIDNSIKIAIDPFLDHDIKKQYQNYLDLNKYELII